MQEVIPVLGKANVLLLLFLYRWAPGRRPVASCSIDEFSESVVRDVCSLRGSFYVAVLRTASDV